LLILTGTLMTRVMHFLKSGPIPVFITQD
jgi:hypothetical protein